MWRTAFFTHIKSALISKEDQSKALLIQKRSTKRSQTLLMIGRNVKYMFLYNFFCPVTRMYDE